MTRSILNSLAMLPVWLQNSDGCRLDKHSRDGAEKSRRRRFKKDKDMRETSHESLSTLFWCFSHSLSRFYYRNDDEDEEPTQI